MKTYDFKCVERGRFLGFVLVSPRKPGLQADDTFVTRVVDVPDHIGPDDVITLLNGTVNISWLGKPYDADGERGRSTLRYDELGIGKIIRD